MQYRTLGKTGLQVSILGFGASSLGGVFRGVSEDDAIRTVHQALDLGINFIDTSPFYGLTRSEVVLGKALAGVDRDRYLLATKVGRYGYQIADCDYSARRVIASVDESLRRMGLDHVDLIQVHDMEFGDMEQILTETLPALEQVRAQGKVRFIGVTGLPLGLFRQVLDSGAAIDAIQSYCRYCLNDTALEDLFPALARHDIGVISSAPLAMRLLTDAGPPDWHPAPPAVRERCAEAARLCRQRGDDLARLALQFAVARPEIHSVLVGTASPDRIAENVRQIAEPLDADLLRDVLEVLAPIHNVTWPQGRPENNEG